MQHSTEGDAFSALVQALGRVEGVTLGSVTQTASGGFNLHLPKINGSVAYAIVATGSQTDGVAEFRIIVAPFGSGVPTRRGRTPKAGPTGTRLMSPEGKKSFRRKMRKYWRKMTPEQRTAEMRRRIALGVQRQLTAAAQTLSA